MLAGPVSLLVTGLFRSTGTTVFSALFNESGLADWSKLTRNVSRGTVGWNSEICVCKLRARRQTFSRHPAPRASDERLMLFILRLFIGRPRLIPACWLLFVL